MSLSWQIGAVALWLLRPRRSRCRISHPHCWRPLIPKGFPKPPPNATGYWSQQAPAIDRVALQADRGALSFGTAVTSSRARWMASWPSARVT